ncbi:MAG: HxsD-like protein [Myxococcota bacterium]
MSVRIRFRRDLYPGACVDEALQVYAPYVATTRKESPDYWEVCLFEQDGDEDGPPSKKERRVAGEVSNFALGLTIRARSRGMSDELNASDSEGLR